MFSQLTRYASELGVPIDDAEMDIRASYDGHGKLLVNDASPGAEWVHYTFAINSPAPSEQIEQLVRMIEKGCHTINTIRQPTPVSGTVIHNGTDLELEL